MRQGFYCMHPENFKDFQKLQEEGILRHNYCTGCGKSFTEESVKTPEGWRETQISGLCELCFDEITADLGEGEEEWGEEE